MWIWPVWRVLEFSLTYLDPSNFQPSPGHASEYTASIEWGCLDGKPAGLACCRFCSSLRMLGVGEAPGCEGDIGLIESHKQPPTWMRKESTTARWASKSLLDIGRLWAFLQPSGIRAFLFIGRSPISYHRGQESSSNSKFTSSQNLIISSPEKLTASIWNALEMISYYELLLRHLTK